MTGHLSRAYGAVWAGPGSRGRRYARGTAGGGTTGWGRVGQTFRLRILVLHEILENYGNNQRSVGSRGIRVPGERGMNRQGTEDF